MIRLQGVPSLHDNTPRQDADAMREENEKLLTGYGAGEGGKVRVPITAAMDRALQNGFKKAGNMPQCLRCR